MLLAGAREATKPGEQGDLESDVILTLCHNIGYRELRNAGAGCN